MRGEYYLDGEEGGQVGGVAGDHQQGKHPPEAGQGPGAGRPQHVVTSVPEERGECLPQRADHTHLPPQHGRANIIRASLVIS